SSDKASKVTDPSAAEAGKASKSTPPQTPPRGEDGGGKPKDSESSGPSVGLQVGRSGNASLSFKTDRPIPFAVRLAEIRLTNSILEVVDGSFKFPASLGSSRIEKATAVLPGNTAVGLSRVAQ